MSLENSSINDNVVTIKIDASRTFQSIHGFGGAFTDAAGVNLNRLDKPAADRLLRAYFSTDGIEYTLGRVPIASCDFSTFEYSYLDTPDDFELKTFSLATEDLELKVGKRVFIRVHADFSIIVIFFRFPIFVPP